MKDFPKYVLGGALNTGITFLLYFSLLDQIHRQPAFAIAFSAGIAFSYYWNVKIVFQSKLGKQSFIKFLPLPIVQLTLSLLVLEAFVLFGFSERIAGFLSILTIVPVMFLLTKSALRIRLNPAPDSVD